MIEPGVAFFHTFFARHCPRRTWSPRSTTYMSSSDYIILQEHGPVYTTREVYMYYCKRDSNLAILYWGWTRQRLPWIRWVTVAMLS